MKKTYDLDTADALGVYVKTKGNIAAYQGEDIYLLFTPKAARAYAKSLRGGTVQSFLQNGIGLIDLATGICTAIAGMANQGFIDEIVDKSDEHPYVRVTYHGNNRNSVSSQYVSGSSKSSIKIDLIEDSAVEQSVSVRRGYDLV